VLTHSGNGGTTTLTGLQFAPGLHWGKRRNAASQHVLTDIARGVDKQLFSSLTSAEQVDALNFVTAFSSDGLTFGPSGGGSGDLNSSGGTYVDWLWKAGGAPVANNAGSMASQVSANVAAGFSIATFTAPGSVAAFTVGHGLGVAPALVIRLSRSQPAARPHLVYHAGQGATKYMFLSSTAAVATDSTMFNNVAPSSSVVTYGTYVSANEQFVQYSFAEVPGFSKIGSYTGNGSADGPFVWCGFRPRFVLIKRADAVANWRILDTVRDDDNVASQELYPSVNNSEATFAALDIVSNGFKLRTTDTSYNASGGTYIFMALAEAPFNYANAR
jgi:hypothetical protein